MTVSPRIRILALAGLIAAVGLAASMFLLRPAATDADTAVPPPAAGILRPANAAPATPEPAAKPKPRAAAVIAPNGLPTSIAAQLSRHELVVASLYSSDAPVDRLSRDEARAGAGDAGAGFAAVDVADRRIALALASRTDSLAAPAVLVFDREGEIVARFDGFADRTLVAGLATPAR